MVRRDEKKSDIETSSAAHREVLTLRLCGCVEVLTEALLLSVPGAAAPV